MLAVDYLEYVLEEGRLGINIEMKIRPVLNPPVFRRRSETAKQYYLLIGTVSSAAARPVIDKSAKLTRSC